MKNILIKIFVVTIAFSFWNCEEEDAKLTFTEARKHAEQFPVEEKAIEEFLTNYSPKITYNANNDVTKIEILRSTDPLAVGLPTFKSYYHADNSLTYTNTYTRKGIKEEVNENNFTGTYPRLIKKDFFHQGITYAYWYLMIKPGATTKIPYGYTTATSARPCELDGVLVDYKGFILKDTVHNSGLSHMLRAKAFDESNYPIEFRLNGVIKGWSRILPKFGSADITTVNGDGSVSYQNYGSGIMILPSGMGYYNNSSTNIPQYSPLVFSFNLYDVKRLDNDNDGILSYREDLYNDGYFYGNNNGISNTLNDDSDGDGTADSYDYDDDGDGLITYREVLNQLTGLPFLDSEYEKLSFSTFDTNGDYIENRNCDKYQMDTGTKSYLIKDKKRNVKIVNNTYIVDCQ